MWRRLFRPNVLFLLGTIQGMLPYGLLAFGENPATALFDISYYPVAIWIIGYICFFVGTRLAGRPVIAPPAEIRVSLRTLKIVVGLLCVTAFVEMVGLTRVYGGVPLLLFAGGQAIVTETTELQTQSGFGQVGASVLIMNLLFSMTVLLALKARQEKTHVLRWVWAGAVLSAMLAVFNGKRQGLFMCAVMAASAFTLSLGSPLTAFESFFRLRMKSRGSILVLIAGAFITLQVISSLVTIRNGSTSDHEGFQELELYYFYPTMNMSLQCIEAGGFGPFEFRPFGTIVALLPAKLELPVSLIGDEPPKVEKTSPSSFYERLQWDMGLWGIIPFCVFFGAISQWLYNQSFHRYAPLLTYGFVAWALFSAPLYNHFFNLIFLPLPAVAFFATSIIYRELKSLFHLARIAPTTTLD
jgi:oligosaccharide repeat unit polymerase